MVRFVSLILTTTLTLFWIAVASALRSGNDAVFSTTSPERDYDYDGDRGDVVIGDGGVPNAEPELEITTVKVPGFLEEVTDGEEELLYGKYKGIIPDLLKALCHEEFMPCGYRLVLAGDGLFGARDIQGHWTGMIGEVMREEVDFAAAPIDITSEVRVEVNFSIPIDKRALTVVVNTKDDVITLDDLTSGKRNITYGGVHGSGVSSMEALRTQSKVPYSTMWSKIESTPDATVKTTEEGINKALKGGYGFITDTDTADYQIRRHCTLKKINEDFLEGEGYGFVFPKQSTYLDNINKGLRKFIDNGEFSRIKEKWFDAECGASGLTPLMSLLVGLLCAVYLL